MARPPARPPLRAHGIVLERMRIREAAAALDLDYSHVSRVLCGHAPVSTKFRRNLVMLLGLPDEVVFPELHESGGGASGDAA